MNLRNWTLIRALALTCLAAATFGTGNLAVAQPYTMDAFAVDSGGGGTSTGGAYVLSGLIGQSSGDTEMAGGSLSISSGFWEAVGQPTTPAPRLTIVPAGAGRVTLSWDTNTVGFVLQTSPTLSPPAWTNAATGTNNPATLPATARSQFFRLLKP